jgi:hypothetical protein
MRYHVSSTVHRNLAASKRSIVIVCAAIAMVLGTTSVGTSFLVPEDIAPVPNTNAIPSEYGEITTDTQPLLAVPAKTLGLQQSVNFGPLTRTQTGRVGVEVGSISAAAVITQINKIVQAPEAPISITPPGPTTSATPPANDPTPEPPVSADPVIEEPEPTPEEPEPPEPPDDLQTNAEPPRNNDTEALMIAF